MGRCTDRRDMTKAVESGVKFKQTNKQNQMSCWTKIGVINFQHGKKSTCEIWQ